MLYRKKFDRYITQYERRAYLEKFVDSAEKITITENITDCEDPKDDQFLELAISGKANLIVSGDPHLLKMNPFRSVAIIKPNDINLE